MSEKRPSILIVAHRKKPGVAAVLDELRPWIESRCAIVADAELADLPAKLDPAGATLCVVFGGDGSILAAARALAHSPMPILGVNMGKLGFLAEFSVAEFREQFDAALAGELRVSRRLMLEVDCGGCVTPAANDVTITSGAPFRMIELEAAHEGDCIAHYRGDGLIVATPSGSTGHNLSSGGAIVHPTVEAIAINPLAPHTLSLRPVVVPAEGEISVKLHAANEGTSLLIDGQIVQPLGAESEITIRPLPGKLLLLTNPGRPYFKTLAEKLHWGRSPRG
ncbi:MAG: NAD(+)/NADH kinase [Phycisphaerales bacterium]|nr:NAD(+)/NADH kinase [Phycisphaerales bacterium]MBT7170481.1 NAD(+)/NADH kinase [Phycisphaerales bacterium]